jgi:pimeloyl-ACP methyl ester carboxylesterase
MWDTDFFSILANKIRDLLGVDDDRRVAPAGFFGLSDRRIEGVLSRPGRNIWCDMKDDARAISITANGLGRMMLADLLSSPAFSQSRDRIHLIGHSAGAILHSHLATLYCSPEFNGNVSSINALAPASTVDLFDETLRPLLAGDAPRVHAYNQWHLSDALEQADRSARHFLGYSKSLLYLVSGAFEEKRDMRIIGMEKYYAQTAKLPNMQAWASGGSESAATEHGAFDSDERTVTSVIAAIKARSAGARTSAAGRTARGSGDLSTATRKRRRLAV